MQSADVLVENFRPGTMERLGLSYEQANSINPALVYCSVSGFGQTGPRAKQPAYDAIVQGMGGIQSMTGEADGVPTRVGVPMADITAGMFAAYAVVSALYWRERDPERRGQWIDTSMLGGQVAMLTYQAGRYFATGQAPGRIGNRHASISPYEMFHTADGYVNVGVANEPMWQRFCHALGLESLLDDERFGDNAQRVANREALNECIEHRAAQAYHAARHRSAYPGRGPRGARLQPRAGLCRPAEPAPRDGHPDTASRKRPTGARTGFPYRLSETPAEVRMPSPLLGEHTEEILREIGYSDEQIKQLD